MSRTIYSGTPDGWGVKCLEQNLGKGHYSSWSGVVFLAPYKRFSDLFWSHRYISNPI